MVDRSRGSGRGRIGPQAADKLHPAEEDYLTAIFKSQQDDEPVSTTVLTHQLEVALSSVSEMLKRLDRKRLVAYVPYRGVTLTEAGRVKATRLVRCHRLAERLLTDVLGLSWEDAHEEAHRLEHAISPLVEERLSVLLNNPQTCPHGHPMPDAQGRLAPDASTPLSRLVAGEQGVVVKIAQESRELLRYVGELGLFPRTPFRVEEVAPFQGPVTVTVNGRRASLGRDVAEMVLVRKVDGDGVA